MHNNEGGVEHYLEKGMLFLIMRGYLRDKKRHKCAAVVRELRNVLTVTDSSAVKQISQITKERRHTS